MKKVQPARNPVLVTFRPSTRALAPIRAMLRKYDIPDSHIESHLHQAASERLNDICEDLWLSDFVFPDRAAAERAVATLSRKYRTEQQTLYYYERRKVTYATFQNPYRWEHDAKTNKSVCRGLLTETS